MILYIKCSRCKNADSIGHKDDENIMICGLQKHYTVGEYRLTVKHCYEGIFNMQILEGS